MARLNPNYQNTITLWNCLKAVDNPAGNVDVWYKTVLADCVFKVVTEQVNSGLNSQMAGAYTVRIPKNTAYLPYAEWVAKAANLRAGFFTMHNDDVVILGSSADTISSTSPNTAAQILAKNKPNAFKVTACADNSGGFQGHYRLGG